MPSKLSTTEVKEPIPAFAEKTTESPPKVWLPSASKSVARQEIVALEFAVQVKVELPGTAAPGTTVKLWFAIPVDTPSTEPETVTRPVKAPPGVQVAE